MDVIREHLMYKNSHLIICMKDLTSQEQYECIRIILERQSSVSICKHDSTNQYMDILISKLQLALASCLVVQPQLRDFLPLVKEQ
jgi:hypothetical protein